MKRAHLGLVRGKGEGKLDKFDKTLFLLYKKDKDMDIQKEKERMRTFLYLLRSIFFVALPSFLSYISQSDSFLKNMQDSGYIGASINIEKTQDFCLIASIVLTVILLGYGYFRVSLKRDRLKGQVESLLVLNKEILTAAISSELRMSSFQYDIRLFLPCNNLRYKIAKLFNSNAKLFFRIKNIESWATPGNTKNLKFEVFPSTEGLVGQCYQKKSMIYDDDLENTNETNYHLSKSQIDQTNDLKFIVCCPVLDGSPKEEVVAIFAYDSKSKVSLSDEQIKKLRIPLNTFSRRMYENVPELCK